MRADVNEQITAAFSLKTLNKRGKYEKNKCGSINCFTLHVGRMHYKSFEDICQTATCVNYIINAFVDSGGGAFCHRHCTTSEEYKKVIKIAGAVLLAALSIYKQQDL